MIVLPGGFEPAFSLAFELRAPLEKQLRVWPTRAKVVSLLSSILGLSSLEAGTLILTLSASTPLSNPLPLLPDPDLSPFT